MNREKINQVHISWVPVVSSHKRTASVGHSANPGDSLKHCLLFKNSMSHSYIACLQSGIKDTQIRPSVAILPVFTPPLLIGDLFKPDVVVLFSGQSATLSYYCSLVSGRREHQQLPITDLGGQKWSLQVLRKPSNKQKRLHRHELLHSQKGRVNTKHTFCVTFNTFHMSRLLLLCYKYKMYVL